MHRPPSGLASLTFHDLLAQIAAKTPAPGGGAVASAAGAIASALAHMVVSYSLGKKNLADHQPALEQAASSLTRASALLLVLADEDAAAYGLVNELSRLPETDARRRAEYPIAVEAAVAAPRATVAACCDLLRLIESLAPISNRHLRSDLAIAAILAEAAARSAWWNVSVNLSLLTDERAKQAIREEVRTELEQAAARRSGVEAACIA